MPEKTDRITKHAEQSEKALEQYLRRRVKELGGLCLKYSNPWEAGYPDRLVCLPGGYTLWVELKSLGEKPTPLQLQRHAQLRRLGFAVSVADRREAIDLILSPYEV